MQVFDEGHKEGFQWNTLRLMAQIANELTISGALMTYFPIQALFFLDVITATIGMGILIFLVKIPSLGRSKNAD